MTSRRRRWKGRSFESAPAARRLRTRRTMSLSCSLGDKGVRRQFVKFRECKVRVAQQRAASEKRMQRILDEIPTIPLHKPKPVINIPPSSDEDDDQGGPEGKYEEEGRRPSRPPHAEEDDEEDWHPKRRRRASASGRSTVSRRTSTRASARCSASSA